MALGMLSSPIAMVISLLLMQGISLSMFRTFLNQALNRDPLRFSMNFGNNQQQDPNNNSNSRSDNNNNNNGIPTPAPIVDPRIIELLTLIRTITPPSQPAQPSPPSQPSQPLSSTLFHQQHQSVVPIVAVASSPIPSTIHSSSITNAQRQQLQTPQIIIMPQLMPLIHHASASDQVKTVVKLKSDQIKPNNNETSLSSSRDINDDEMDDGEHEILYPDDDAVDNIQVHKQKKRTKTKKNKNDHISNKDNLIIFEAVGVDIGNGGRHPNHNYDSVDNKKN